MLGRLHVVIASASWTSLAMQDPGQVSGMCDALLKHVVVDSGGGGDVDWSRVLGMVNVAAVRYWGPSPVPLPAVSTCSHRAFVVGVNAYNTAAGIRSLASCVGDAQAMADLLDSRGYDVVRVLDPTRSQLVTAFEAFCASLTSSTVKAVVHFSGHGVAPAGEQFLLAADASGL